jgi:hypothetical protein
MTDKATDTQREETKRYVWVVGFDASSREYEPSVEVNIAPQFIESQTEINIMVRKAWISQDQKRIMSTRAFGSYEAAKRYYDEITNNGANDISGCYYTVGIIELFD